MTKKHFNAIAKNFKDALESARAMLDDSQNLEFHRGQIQGIKESARLMAEICAENNANFDTRRFLTACGIE